MASLDNKLVVNSSIFLFDLFDLIYYEMSENYEKCFPEVKDDVIKCLVLVHNSKKFSLLS